MALAISQDGMWWLLAMAGADELGRASEPLRVTRYARLEGAGPVTGLWRNRSGAHQAWHFADGQIEHVESYEGKALQTTRTFGVDGRPEVTVDWVAGQAIVHFQPAVPVPMAGWVDVTIAGLTLRAPPGLVASGAGAWAGPGLSIAVQPAADPFLPAFRDEVVAACGCAIEARRTVWIAGRPGVALRLERPDRTADLVAVSGVDGLLVFTAVGEGAAGLAPLRAMMASAREIPP